VFALHLLYAADGSGELAFDFRDSYVPAAHALVHGHTIYGFGYTYPPLLAELVAPLLLLPAHAALWAASLLCFAAYVASLRIVGVRDPLVIFVAAMAPSLLLGAQVANGTALMCVLTALAWRYGAIAGGASIAVKLVAWPLVPWFWFTRGIRAALSSVAAAAAFVLVPWALIGFDGIEHYWGLARDNATSQSGLTYAISTSGLPGGRMLAAALTVIALAGCWWQRSHHARSFAFAIAAALAATPVLWGFYFTLAMLALAVQRPRLSASWFVFLLLWITPGTGMPTEWWSKVFGLTLVFSLLTWLGLGAPVYEAALRLRRASGLSTPLERPVTPAR
jgi:hypothetical protein